MVTPGLIGLLSATLVFLLGYRLRERRFFASQRERKMQALLRERTQEPQAVPPPRRAMAARLEGAGLKLSPAIFYGLHALGAIGGFLLISSAGLPLLPSLLGGLAGALLPGMWLNRRERARVKAIDEALPDGLATLASSLRSFPDLKIALGRATEILEEEGHTELAREFSRLAADVGLLGAEEAVRRMKTRTPSKALAFTATLLGIYAAQGGKVLTALEARAKNLRMLIEARREAEAAVNDARLAGLAVPLIMVLVVLTNLRDPQAAAAYHTPLGQALLVGAAISCYIGYRTVVSMAENIG